MTSSLTIDQGTAFAIAYDDSMDVNIVVQRGWNIVGVPVMLTTTAATVLAGVSRNRLLAVLGRR